MTLITPFPKTNRHERNIWNFMAYLFGDSTDSNLINQLIKLQNKTLKTETDHFQKIEHNFKTMSKKEELFQVYVAFNDLKLQERDSHNKYIKQFSEIQQLITSFTKNVYEFNNLFKLLKLNLYANKTLFCPTPHIINHCIDTSQTRMTINDNTFE